MREQPGATGTGLADGVQQQHLRINALQAQLVGVEQGLAQCQRSIHFV
jgi:hypothetical protein